MPPNNKTNKSSKYLDIFDQSVNLSKHNNKQAKKIKLVKPKVESNTMNETFAQSQASEKKSEAQKDKQHEEILKKDLIAIKGTIFVCKICGQKSKNQDFIMKHVGTHLKEIM